MSKRKKNTTTKTSAKVTQVSDAQTQATDAAANASTVAPAPAKGSKTKTPKTPKASQSKKTSGLDAAHQVLKDAGEPLRCKDMVQTMLAKGLWKTGGKTPTATISAAVHREIQSKGSEARFKKTDRGLFTVNGV